MHPQSMTQPSLLSFHNNCDCLHEPVQDWIGSVISELSTKEGLNNHLLTITTNSNGYCQARGHVDGLSKVQWVTKQTQRYQCGKRICKEERKGLTVMGGRKRGQGGTNQNAMVTCEKLLKDSFSQLKEQNFGTSLNKQMHTQNMAQQSYAQKII